MKTYRVLKDYLHTVAVIKKLGETTKNFPKIIDEKEIQICNCKHIYIGVYSGAIKTVDREAAGIVQYSLSQLKEEMVKFPEAFTSDLRILVREYGLQLDAFAAFLKET